MLLSRVKSHSLGSAHAIVNDNGRIGDQRPLTQGAQAPPAIVPPAVRDGQSDKAAGRSALAPPAASECPSAKVHCWRMDQEGNSADTGKVSRKVPGSATPCSSIINPLLATIAASGLTSRTWDWWAMRELCHTSS